MKNKEILRETTSPLQDYYNKNNGRLPTTQIPDEVKELVGENKALKVFK